MSRPISLSRSPEQAAEHQLETARQLRAALARNPVEGGEQGLDLACPPIQPLRESSRSAV
jgi:hypothetical protein